MATSDGAPDDIFGVSVAVDGSYIVVGSRLNCDSLQHPKNSCVWRVPVMKKLRVVEFSYK